MATEILITCRDIQRRLKCTEHLAKQLIKDWKLPLVHTAPYGRGVMQFYHLQDAEPHFLAWEAKNAPKAPSSVVTRVGDNARLQVLVGEFQDFTDSMNKVVAQLDERLAAQNRVLLLAMEKQHGLITKIMKDLGVKVDA